MRYVTRGTGGLKKFKNLLEKYGGIKTYTESGRILAVNIHHMYLHSTRRQQRSRCLGAGEEIASHAGRH